MAICRYILITLSFIFWIFSTSVFADFEKLKKTEITTMDFLLTKFDNFFIKNQHKMLSNNPLLVRYESINYDVIYKEGKNIEIFLEAIMDRSRYKKKKYSPKKVDCNIIRNRIFYNMIGYTAFRRKINYALSESEMVEILKTTIYNLENFDEELKSFLINKTKIMITIKNPVRKQTISCSGKLSDLELK